MAEDIDVASHYGIQTAFPETWPAELDESDVSESEQYSKGANAKRRSTRYSALGRGPGLLGGSHRTGDNVAKKDESDPLGSSDSVMYILKKRGIPVDDDMRLRNRFLLSSTSFSPALFLSQAHQNASAEELIEGLQFLSRSIDQKSASLKELVEANFERFVRAKATIDSVYTEMRYHGAAKSRPPSHRASGQYRYSLVGNAPPAPASQSANKTALVKESEYGVKGIRAPLVEASVKAEELWGPALSGREREKDLYAVVASVERNRAVFEIGGNISKAIKQRDFDRVFEEYRRAKTLTNEARSISDRAATEKRELTDAESHIMIGTGRMWTDVEQQVDAFKRDLWRRLSNVHTPSSSHLTAAGPVEEHMELIGALLELGVEDNPVWVWLISSFELLKTKLTAFCERSIVEIEVLRRRLAASEKPSPRVMTALFRASLREGADPKDKIDTDQAIELWECIQAFLTKLLSVQTGLLGEVIEFWETAQSFINGSKQKMLPTGFEGESRKHHQLPSDGVRELQEGIVELVDLIRQNVLALFTEPPIEDISLLFSPLPPTPGTPRGHLTPTESRFKLDPKNAPPPSPIRGEIGEEYAFWPPYSNSLSGVHYLSKFLVLIGTAASEMAALSPITAESKSYDHLKSLVSVTRERCVRVACATWNRDAENCKMLEDWTRDPERRELTTMPGLFVAFESTVLAGMQKILYISEAMSKAGSVDVVTPPPAKILQMVRTQFVTSVYKALSGLVENAERPVMTNDEDSWILAEPSRPAKSMDSAPIMATSESIDAKNRNIRMLLTLSNLKAFQTDFVPQLVSNFETAFSVKLTDEAKTIRDVLGQIDDRLFQSYTTPTIVALDATIKTGIKSADWVPATARPDQVRPYVYSTMLTLVLVHTEITTTIPISPSNAPSSSSTAPTAHPLLTSVLNHLVTKISLSLLEAFQSRSKYSLPALMQATLDTEFIAQTMSQYVTEEASSIQSQIYLELDRRTNNEARAKLQAELGEMRGILKKLRERTKGEFTCFRKIRAPLGSKGSTNA